MRVCKERSIKMAGGSKPSVYIQFDNAPVAVEPLTKRKQETVHPSLCILVLNEMRLETKERLSMGCGMNHYLHVRRCMSYFP